MSVERFDSNSALGQPLSSEWDEMDSVPFEGASAEGVSGSIGGDSLEETGDGDGDEV